MPTVADLVALMDGWYPPETALSFDAVGLVCGDPRADVERVLLAVDPVQEVIDEAVDSDIDMLVVHHPLLLSAVHSIATTVPKGRAVHTLLSNGCALLTAHTNADAPAGGVSQAMAEALGLQDVRPLEPHPVRRDKLVVFVPTTHEDGVRRALTEAGAGAVGDYDSCTFTTEGTGRFRPLLGAQPHIGTVGSEETVGEVRIETVLDRRQRGAVLAAMRTAHPYEEPAFDIFELVDEADPASGMGRVGTLRPMPLRDFAELVSHTFPPTAHGVRVAGDPERVVKNVALCGGSGDSMLTTARRAGADVYLTSDLRHHPASEHLEHPDAPALVDIAHAAAEWMWLPLLRRRLTEALGDSVEVSISTRNTDPWTFRVDHSEEEHE